MSFLQPWLLAALPLVALPVIIHLINQRRFQTIRWGAMMFLLAANRMSRGYARLRQWLILLFRMLAIAGLIFAVSRPLASGLLGLTAGGRPDTTIIVLDRSPSMREQGPGTPISKLETGRAQLVRALGMRGSAHWVLIDSAGNQPRELASLDELATLPATEPASASADLPTLLQTAHDYIHSNQSGNTEVWICSDLRAHDWNAPSGRWQSIRDRFLEFSQGVRFHLLAYAASAPGNLGVRVTNVQREQIGDQADVLISLQLTRTDAEGAANVSVPIAFEIEGARSEITVDVSGPQYELRNHRLPIDKQQVRGWGKVSIPFDANPSDNEHYFVFDQPAPRRTIVVADDPLAARPLMLAAEISPNPSESTVAEALTVDDLGDVEWDDVALVLWQGALPTEPHAQALQRLIDRGGQVIFFPPQATTSDSFAGVSWQAWTENSDGVAVETWRGDQDLLANTQSGTALPVGDLKILRHCGMTGEFTTLASLPGGVPLLTRVTTNRGGVYFCSTWPQAGASTLANNGVVLYVVVQRALVAGALGLGNTRQLIAGPAENAAAAAWRQLAGPAEALSTDYAYHAGVYADGERLLAVNRAAEEDQPAVLADAAVAELFRGLDFVRVDDQAGSLASLIQEIWRMFLALMMLALVAEAALCLPKLAPATPKPAGVLA